MITVSTRLRFRFGGELMTEIVPRRSDTKNENRQSVFGGRGPAIRSAYDPRGRTAQDRRIIVYDRLIQDES